MWVFRFSDIDAIECKNWYSESLTYDMMVARSNNPPKIQDQKIFGENFNADQCPFYWFHIFTILIKFSFSQTRVLGSIQQRMSNFFKNSRSKITIIEFRGVLWRFIVLKLRLILKRFKCGIQYLNRAFNIPYLKASSTLITCLSYLYFKSWRDLGLDFWRGMNFHPVARLSLANEWKTYAQWYKWLKTTK